jgi:hypothetical protein
VNTNYLNIAIGMAVTSLGMGITMSPATNSIMGSIPVDEAGVGSAMNDTTRQIGGALGVAILGTLLNSAYTLHIDKIVWPVPLSTEAVTKIRGSIQGAQIVAATAQNQSPALAQFIVKNADEAFTYSMAHALLVAAIIMAVTAVLALFIVPSRVRPYNEVKSALPKTPGKDDSK